MASQQQNKPLLIIVTGLSGAGNSTALDALADNGLYCIDNLPVEMLSDAVDMIESKRMTSHYGFAICMDVRDSRFAQDLPNIKAKLEERVKLDVLFLTSNTLTIATRYSATRRRHPLLVDGTTLMEAIDEDRELLAPIEEGADFIIDTTDLKPQELIAMVLDRYEKELPERVLHLTISSFGYKYGPLQPVDMLYDVRFLTNPFYEKQLKEKTGLDSVVQDFVMKSPLAQEMLHRMDDFNRFLLPKYLAEGKHYFRLGIGCSGGRHRSVTLAEGIGKYLMANPIPNVLTTILHRDIDRL